MVANQFSGGICGHVEGTIHICNRWKRCRWWWDWAIKYGTTIMMAGGGGTWSDGNGGGGGALSTAGRDGTG